MSELPATLKVPQVKESSLQCDDPCNEDVTLKEYGWVVESKQKLFFDCFAPVHNETRALHSASLSPLWLLGYVFVSSIVYLVLTFVSVIFVFLIPPYGFLMLVIDISVSFVLLVFFCFFFPINKIKGVPGVVGCSDYTNSCCCWFYPYRHPFYFDHLESIEWGEANPKDCECSACYPFIVVACLVLSFCDSGSEPAQCMILTGRCMDSFFVGRVVLLFLFLIVGGVHFLIMPILWWHYSEKPMEFNYCALDKDAVIEILQNRKNEMNHL